MTIKVLQLGLGQQGQRNLGAMDKLLQGGLGIEVVGCADLNPEKLTLASLFKVSKNSSLYPDSLEAIARELDGVDVVFDSTWTPQHRTNIEGILALNKSDYPLRVVACEKPAFLTHEEADDVIRKVMPQNLVLTENVVEIFGDPVEAVISDIIENEYDILETVLVRGGPVKGKTVSRGERGGIYQHFSGAFHDKSEHDISRIVYLYLQRYGEIPNPIFEKIDMELLQLIATNGREFYFNRKGQLVFNYETGKDEQLNDAYTTAEFYLDGTKVTIISSWVDFKREHLDMIEKWYTPSMQKSIEEKFGIIPSVVYGEPDWDQQSRTHYILALSKDGKKVRYLISTLQPFFAVKQMGNKRPEALYGDSSDSYGKLLRGYIKDAINVVQNGSDSRITMPLISNSLKLREMIVNAGYEEAYEKRKIYTIDLRKETREPVLRLLDLEY